MLHHRDEHTGDQTRDDQERRRDEPEQHDAVGGGEGAPEPEALALAARVVLRKERLAGGDGPGGQQPADPERPQVGPGGTRT